MADKPWLLHYDKGVPHELHYPDAAITGLLEGAAKRFPNRMALEFLGFSMTYAQLWEAAQKFATALQQLGIKNGDRVAVMLPNCPQFVISFYGATLIGAVVVNTSPLYVARELEHQLKDSGAETLILLSNFFPRYREIAANAPVRRVIVTGIEDYLPFPKNLLYPVKARREKTWVSVKPEQHIFFFKHLLEKYPAQPGNARVQADDLALLQYTGGTTGTPKAAMLTHRNLMANVFQAAAWTADAKDGQEVMLGVIPFFHVYGMTVAMNLAIKQASSIILLPRFNTKDVLEAIQKHRPTMFPGVPTMYIAINNHKDVKKYDLSSIKACISGAAPLPLEVAHAFEGLTGGHLVEGYGLTEASPCTHNNPIFGEKREGGIGLPMPGIDCRIINELGQTVAVGEIGELAVSGPNVMLGYWQRPDETAKCIRESLDDGKTPGRWLLTGDMVRMDKDGYFYVVDRKKDMIDASGYNVYPREIEEILYQHPKIKEAVVVGVPDPYRGETVKAYVVLKDNETASEAEILEFCKLKLAPYKTPKFLEFRTDLPKTLIGKILRRALLEEERAKTKTAAEHAPLELS
jgi:long-chain acyl-CoA synthetase